MDSFEKELEIAEKLQHENLSIQDRTKLVTKLTLLRRKRERGGRFSFMLIIVLMILGFIMFVTNN